MIIISHRGHSLDGTQENTIEAIINAWNHGADAVEIDICFHDGHLWLSHDLPLQEGAQLLVDVLDRAPTFIYGIFLDVKVHNDKDEMIECFKKLVVRTENKLWFQSFDHCLLHNVIRIGLPYIHSFGMLVEDNDHDAPFAGITYMAVPLETYESFKKHDLPILVWTITKAEEWNALDDVAGAFTDVL